MGIKIGSSAKALLPILFYASICDSRSARASSLVYPHQSSIRSPYRDDYASGSGSRNFR